MDIDDAYAPEVYDETNGLSYDDTIAYEEQLPADSTAETSRTLANRIGRTKVYLLSESRSVGGKRKRDGSQDARDELEEEFTMEEDSPYRTNALLFQGTPISHLPTSRLFAYATQFDAHPMGLEWIDDTTCVFVFTSKTAAQSAHGYLLKSATEEEDEEGYVTAKPIPVEIWPPEERINKSLGKAEGLRGVIRMRWARHEDVKKKGAKKESEFYRKHGATAGKELHGVKTPLDAESKRRRGNVENGGLDEATERARLDEDLDNFLAADSNHEDDTMAADEPPDDEPPSKMRSDYIATDGRTLLERTSVMRIQPDSLASRLTSPWPKRRKNNEGAWEMNGTDLEWGRERERRPRGGRQRGGEQKSRSGDHRARPKKSQQELDDELDAFLSGK
ncbi:hypothetical protein BDN71DRAFT_1502266 [Pleurotus eryngii]|uniref:Chromatin target of PRMT1 protein C-terminal domain-containing protein n=1 Tax=Pleurotus eryngii TaxID=5323 RepID=A0A9P6DCX7_PLEER|nr:hypothetical protein BDN71DRAFT_1502266 [Pleurotus eryngii]